MTFRPLGFVVPLLAVAVGRRTVRRAVKASTVPTRIGTSHRCESVGDPHVTPFDGVPELPGLPYKVGAYKLIQLPAGSGHGLQVDIRFDSIYSTPPSRNTGIAVHGSWIGNNKLVYEVPTSVGHQGPSDLDPLWNGQSVLPFKSWEPMESRIAEANPDLHLKVTRDSTKPHVVKHDFYFYDSYSPGNPDGLLMHIHVLARTHPTSHSEATWFDIWVDQKKFDGVAQSGLCGNYDGNRSNDQFTDKFVVKRGGLFKFATTSTESVSATCENCMSEEDAKTKCGDAFHGCPVTDEGCTHLINLCAEDLQAIDNPGTNAAVVTDTIEEYAALKTDYQAAVTTVR